LTVAQNIQNDTGKLATTVAKEREMSAKLIGELTTDLAVFRATPMEVTSRSDPYVANALVLAQLTKQVHAENALQKSIIIMQQNSAHFEAGLVRAVQSAWATFDEWQARMSGTVQDTWKGLGAHLAALEPDREWIEFAARSDQLVDPETPLRNPAAIGYPHRGDPATDAVHAGYLERKKRFTHSYKESYYVLTPAGFLHEYASSDPVSAPEPSWSLFLPACTLGPPSKSSTLSGSHKFHIQWERGPREGGGATAKAKTGLARLGSIGKGGGSGGSAYTFRARSHGEMMEWWNDVRMLCSRYLVASEAVERQGPVMAAVRAAGYTSEDSESGGGSSEDDELEDGYVSVGTGSVPGGLTDDETLAGYDHSKAGSESGVKRRLSQRQQDKMPEGRSVRGDETPGADEVEPDGGPRGRSASRFKEGV
jgi:hypothetical protein